MSYPIKAVTLATLLVAFFISPAAEAKINIQPDFQGTLLVTFPDGKVQMYDAGEAVPDIPSGASIEVFGGKVSISVDQGESIKLSCLGSEASVGGGSSASVACGEDDGKLSVEKGSAQVKQADGTQKDVAEGQEYTIKPASGGEENEPPTGEGNPLGTTAPEVNPPDSRSMEASPSQ